MKGKQRQTIQKLGIDTKVKTKRIKYSPKILNYLIENSLIKAEIETVGNDDLEMKK